MRTIIPYWTTRSLTSDLFNEMDRFFNDWNPYSSQRVYDERSLDHSCEFAENEDHYIFSVDLPGMKKENIKIEVVGNQLTISGERKRENLDKGQKNQDQEKIHGYFKRSFSLPTSVDSEKVEARYEDGVLELYLPKTPTSKPRQIQIQTGKGGIFERLLSSKKDDTSLKDVSSAKAS